MPDQITISVDAMGGDSGPSVSVAGCALALQRLPDTRFLLVGDQAKIMPELAKFPELQKKSDVIHTDIAVGMDDKPSQALRRGRRVSSMWMALNAVADGRAGFAISAGNTGALMAMARFALKMMPNVSRPAIAGIWPTLRGESIVLDMGATIGVDSRWLVDFAVMGEAMARALFGIERPSVGLLNIGVEEVKGLDEVKAAHQRLRDSNLPMRYVGFVEGDDIGQGTVDVVVTEGFSGNIALKTAEGTAKQFAAYLRSAMNETILSRLGYLLARSAFKSLKEKMDPRRSNGGVFLGLNGIVIKSHGGTDNEGFAAAVALGYEMASNKLLEKISADLDLHRANEIEMAESSNEEEKPSQ